MVPEAATGGEEAEVPLSDGGAAMDEVNAAAPAPEEDEGKEENAENGEEEEQEATVENAAKLFESGCNALKAGDLESASNDLCKALEMRVMLHGELAPECASAYYKYGSCLLYKVQAERDIFSEATPAKEKGVTISEPAEAEEESNEAEEKVEGEDGEDIQEEEESDLELAWKMMDIARVIHERQHTHTLEEVDVISGLADISLEKEDFQTCLDDYSKALEILKGLVEPDNRQLAELYFKMALAKQLSKAPKEAIECCHLAVAVCENRLERLKGEVTCRDEEIKEMELLLVDLKEKVDELHQMAAAPPLLEVLEAENPVVAETVKQTFMAVADMASNGSKAPMETTTTTMTTPSTSKDAVINLGVVGRGIKRATPVLITDNGSVAKVSKAFEGDTASAGDGSSKKAD
ncbi:protein HGV2 [Selaginella moellendorffii]|nr:protein HGV2 [Selaginella moellendorffii]|eukprot:XP_002963501.2 protein HGV2 [Selaginella moellendorffii]